MSIKNYYMILGVSRTETPSRIRAAYRELAKKLHPDHSGQQGAAAFREATEAYQTLSNQENRRRYDQQLRAAGREASLPLGVLRRPAQPVHIPPRPIFRDPASVHPSFDAMRERWMRNFTGFGAPKSEHLEGLNLEVRLSPEEALRGGDLPVSAPVFRICPVCQGSGRDWLYPCLRCREEGVVEAQATVRVRIPPMVRPGTVIEVPLDGFGIHNFYIRVHVLPGEDLF